MKFKCELKSEYFVEFENPDACIEFFVNGDWKNSFYDLLDLKDVAEHISYAFAATAEEFLGGGFFKFIEGFGYFARQDYSNVWICSNEDGESYGDIIVTGSDDFYVEWVDEVEEVEK